METFTNEIENALLAKLWYAAIVLSLTLPDVCAALESADGESTGARYKAWCKTRLVRKYGDQMTANDMWNLRCSVLHQGKFGHRRLDYDRIFVTLRPNGTFFHRNVFNGALNLDLVWFCKDVVESVEEWFAQAKTNPQVQKNLARLAQFHADGLQQILTGVPTIG